MSTRGRKLSSGVLGAEPIYPGISTPAHIHDVKNLTKITNSNTTISSVLIAITQQIWNFKTINK